MIDTFPDLDCMRLPHEQTPKRTAKPYCRRTPWKAPQVQGEFLKGPIRLDWLGTAATLPGKALATALAIMFEVGRRRCPEITLTTAILQRFGVGRKAKYRALKHLQSAGLIAVHQKPRRNPVVTVLDNKEKRLADAHRQDGTGTVGIGSENHQANLNDIKERVNLCVWNKATSF
jgi:hypothetical protein